MPKKNRKQRQQKREALELIKAFIKARGVGGVSVAKVEERNDGHTSPREPSAHTRLVIKLSKPLNITRSEQMYILNGNLLFNDDVDPLIELTAEDRREDIRIALKFSNAAVKYCEIDAKNRPNYYWDYDEPTLRGISIGITQAKMLEFARTIRGEIAEEIGQSVENMSHKDYIDHLTADRS